MYSRIIRPPKNKGFFLFGPRGTGKTHWVKTQFPQALYIDLLESETYNDLLAGPQRLASLIPEDFDDWIIIDEIQRVPNLLNEVHRLIEKHHYKFILTGSSARKLRQKGVNLLAGRLLTYHLHPLTAAELGSDFKMEKSLRYGHLPSVFQEEDPAHYLESYLQTYLREEVQQEGLTRNLGAFSRFLEAASFSQGSILNISEVSRECAVERKVAENYFTILEDLLIATRVPCFTKKAKRRMVNHPKFYFFDVGIYRTVRPRGPLDRPEEMEGAAYETLFFQELRAINDYLSSPYQIFYWRTSTQLEVDFVLYGPKGIHAFEVKRTNKIRSDDLSGLKAFLSDYPMAKATIVYGGEKTFHQDKIAVEPIQDLLPRLSEYLDSA